MLLLTVITLFSGNDTKTMEHTTGQTILDDTLQQPYLSGAYKYSYPSCLGVIFLYLKPNVFLIQTKKI